MTDKEFETAFEKYMSKKRDCMKTEYNRVLPSGELIFNRFEKSVYLQCGEGTSIYDTSVVIGDVIIGSHVWVGPYTLLEGSNGKLIIGDYVSIDTGVTIYTHDSTKHFVSLDGVDPFVAGDVIIGCHSVIGTMSMISCGVNIGKHCVIGAHSFVNRDVPDYSIVAGIPAEIIGHVQIDEEGHAHFCYI